MKRRLDLAAALVHNPEVAVPRRADHRARPDQPRPRVGGGAPAERRARHDDLPHHAVPRGGRRARRPRRHPQRRPAGRRGHARPSSSARSATTSSSPASTATATSPRRAVAGIDGVGPRRDPRRRAHDRDAANGAAAISPVAVALNECGVRVREHHAAHTDARRRVPRAHRQPHPARTHRRRGGRSAHDHRSTRFRTCSASPIRARKAGLLHRHDLDRRPRAPQHPRASRSSCSRRS